MLGISDLKISVYSMKLKLVLQTTIVYILRMHMQVSFPRGFPVTADVMEDSNLVNGFQIRHKSRKD
jgi:hypothetical protein